MNIDFELARIRMTIEFEGVFQCNRNNEPARFKCDMRNEGLTNTHKMEPIIHFYQREFLRECSSGASTTTTTTSCVFISLLLLHTSGTMKQRRNMVFILAKRLAVLVFATAMCLPLVIVVYSHRLLSSLEEKYYLQHSSYGFHANDVAVSQNITVTSTTRTNQSFAELPFRWLDGCLVQPRLSQRDTRNAMQPMSTYPPKSNKSPPTGIVVVLATGTDDSAQVQQDNFRRICKALPTQIEYFLEPQGLDMLFLVEESQGWTVESIVACLRLEAVESNVNRTWHNLDGSILHAVPHHMDPRRTSRQSVPKLATVYVGTTQTQYPNYIQKDPSILKQPIIPKSCEAPRKYIQATRWYSRELLHLGILQDYDYFLKLDTDILFVDTIPFHLLYDMQRKNAVFGHTAEYHPKGSKTCAQGIRDAVLNFTESSASEISKTPDGVHWEWKGSSCSTSPELEANVDWYYTNFIIGDVRFWQSPWVLRFSDFLNEHPKGFFSYRWTDQIFWHHAMGLFLENYSDHVADYTNLRCMPQPNCWYSSYDFRKFGHDAWHRCDNDGFFLHAKDYQISSHNRRNTKPRRRLVWNETTSPLRPLFQSTYQKHC
jgi:hypothetical protein